MFTVSEIRDRIEELEANGTQDENSVEDGAETENSENLAKFKEFIEFIDVGENATDDDFVDVLLRHFDYDNDVLETVMKVIRDGKYSMYDDAEAYGREIIDCCESLPDHIMPYIDFEQYGRDMLQNTSDWTELDTGEIIIFNG